MDERTRNPVAVGEAVRRSGPDDGAALPQRLIQDDARREPVHIGVAEDEDRLARGDRPLQPRYRPVHVGQAVRVVERLEARLQKSDRLRAVVDAAVEEELGGQRMEAQLVSEPIGQAGIRRLHPPHGLHQVDVG